MELSKRLQAVADFVSDGLTVADVGTDHGYIPIYLIKTGKSSKVLAMDINEGPLSRAREHIAAHGLEHVIDLRQSDGVKKLNAGEYDCVVIAGMGGALTVKILEEGAAVFRKLKEFVLQPQSELAKVRKYLCDHAYSIVAENMVLEDGKFYPMMKVISGQGTTYNTIELCYGKRLLEQKHPVLKSFLKKEMALKEHILQNLSGETGTHIETRKEELQGELEDIKYALQRYYSCD